MPTLDPDNRPKIFIGGECSGVVRNAIWELCPSAYVVSADLKAAEDGYKFERHNGGHWIGDMCDVVDMFAEDQNYFDAGLWHPVCTYLTHSAAWAYEDPDYNRYPGVGYHQQVRLGTLTGERRREAREEQLNYIRRIWKLPIGRRYIENPAQGALNSVLGRPTQVVQPYMFGDDASKATGIWVHHGAELEVPPESDWVAPRMVDGRPRWANQTDSGQNNLSPSPDRTADRSRTYPGLGKALARALLLSAKASGAKI